MLVFSHLIMDTHDNFMSIDVHMSLHQRHWLVKYIVAGTNEVYVKDLVISYYAEHSLVVVVSRLRVELNDDTSLGVRLNCALSS
jgi:hypothetical protein